MDSAPEITSLLQRASAGERDALEALLPLVYDELRALAGAQFRGSPANHTLQPTALVHEVFMRVFRDSAPDWQSRPHFMAVAGRAMRQILVDHARRKGAAKRGGGWDRVSLTDLELGEGDAVVEILTIVELLERLGGELPRAARVVELKVFGGLTGEEIAEVTGVTRRTVDNDWRFAKAWLHRALLRPDPA